MILSIQTKYFDIPPIMTRTNIIPPPSSEIGINSFLSSWGHATITPNITAAHEARKTLL